MADLDLNMCSAVFPTQLGEANYQLESRLADSTRELQSKTLTAGAMGMRSEMFDGARGAETLSAHSLTTQFCASALPPATFGCAPEPKSSDRSVPQDIS